MKRIKALRTEPYGLFIDQEQGIVAIDPATGTILLDEGEGKDCFHGAAIAPEACSVLELTSEAKGASCLILKLGSGRFHDLGWIKVTRETENWLRAANRVIAVHRPRNHKVETTAEVSFGITRIAQPEKRILGFTCAPLSRAKCTRSIFPTGHRGEKHGRWRWREITGTMSWRFAGCTRKKLLGPVSME